MTDFYEELRRAVLSRLGVSCHVNKCEWRAFEHDHTKWAEGYAEWLIKIALISDLFSGRIPERHIAVFMSEHPPENWELICAQRVTT